MKRTIAFLLTICLPVLGSDRLPRMHPLTNGSPGSGPTSNAINDILVVGDAVWTGAGRGISRTMDFGTTWTVFSQTHGLGRGGVSAMAEGYGMFWAATAFDSTTEVGTFSTGGGLSYTLDNGETWTWIPQPVDSPDVTDYAPTTTEVQNVTYDIALTEDAVWITSWGGGLRKSEDLGSTWEVVTVDGKPFDALAYLTHRPFAVRYDGEALWVGTAGGIHKSTDGGASWTTFNHQNQDVGISGNFIVALEIQEFEDVQRVWAATIEAMDSTEVRAVSMSEDGGLSWKTILEGEFAHNFGFDHVTGDVFVPTDNGLFTTPDFGKTWAVFSNLVDSERDERVYSDEVYSVGVSSDGGLWTGTRDGLALTYDEGLTWTLFRAFQPARVNGTPRTYAYPNPFSPLRHNFIEGDGHVRFQYRTTMATEVTVRVYDFGMNLVRTVVEGKSRTVAGDFAEVWDGKNGLDEMVANGVYFYSIQMTGEEMLWGKVMVVN